MTEDNRSERPFGASAAPGKVILLGEHAVVYGRPAIAATLGRGLGATAELDAQDQVLRIPYWGKRGLRIRLGEQRTGFEVMERAFEAALTAADLGRQPLTVTVDGSLPPGVGLGSSAAFAVAVLRALGEFRGRPFSGDELIEAATSVESVFHGTPSGVDHTVIALGGCVRFEQRADETVRRLDLVEPLPVVVGWTPREGVTREVVARLRDRRNALPALYERLFDAIGELVEAGEQAIAAHDLETLGALFDLNHGYLNACGVSTVAIERMVAVARDNGALGAKMTGAGCGGAVIALAPEGTIDIVGALEKAGFEAFPTELGGP